MSTTSITEWDQYQKISLRTYSNVPVTFSFDILYSIVWIEHYEDVIIDFEHIKFNGHYLVFLCPEEILEVKNYVSLSIITIPDCSGIIENDNFIYGFGNIKKYFELCSLSLFKIKQLFDKLQNRIYDNKNSDELQHVVSEILNISLILTKTTDSKDYLLVCKFIGLVHENYKMHHQMSFYSKRLSTTPKYIAEKFHLLGIMSPHKFIKDRILIEAKRQLLFTDKTARVICFDIGFNDSAYFARFFKKNTGMTTNFFKKAFKRLFGK